MSAAAIAWRSAERKPLLRVRCETDSGARDCLILELNSCGAFIESFVPLVTGSSVGLRFCLPNGHTVFARGVVKYHQFKIGFGVEFTHLSMSDRRQISNFVGC
jgi:hypothetical protein